LLGVTMTPRACIEPDAGIGRLIVCLEMRLAIRARFFDER
jgi:hypothetical protein